MSFAGVVPLPAQSSDETLTRACGDDPGWLCESVLDVTNSAWIARLVDGVVKPILLAVIVVVVAALLSRWLRRVVSTVIDQFARRDRYAGAALGKLGVGGDSERDAIRAQTLSTVARTAVTAVIWTIAVLLVLGVFSINLGPLIAGAGIAGIAVGLGAQQLVRDCISGFFILLEDQCGVGDVIDVGPAIGTVESITLRATTVRDDKGTLWTVPNGTILRIGNKSRGWAQGTIDVAITSPAQLDEAVGVIERVAAELSTSAGLAPQLLAPIAVPGVESLTADGAQVRVEVRTLPGREISVLRSVRAELCRQLTAAGIGSDAAP
jgi:small conductance mechanosensitive channel